MYTYCLRHTLGSTSLGWAMLIAGGAGPLCPDEMDPLGGTLDGLGVIVLLGALLVAVWPKVPRLQVCSHAFGVRGFLGRDTTFDEHPWETILGIEPDGLSPDEGFVVVTTKGRVRVRKNTAGLSELRRLFDKIAQSPEDARVIFANDCCEDDATIELRKNWQMGISPTLMLPGAIWLLTTTLPRDNWPGALFDLLLFGAGGVMAAIYIYQFFLGPFRVRLKGTTLTISGAIRSRQWDLREITEMGLLPDRDSECLRIRTNSGEFMDIRLQDLFEFPVFDRAWYSIQYRWRRIHTAGDEPNLEDFD